MIELVRDEIKATNTTHASPLIAVDFNPVHNLVRMRASIGLDID